MPEKERLGLSVQSVTPDIARSLGLDQAQGVIVSTWKSRGGGRFVERGHHPRGEPTAIKSAAELQKMIDNAKAGANLLFLVRRSGNNLFLAMSQR